MCSAESFDFDAFEELCFRDDPISSEKYGVRVMNIQQTGTFFKQLVFICLCGELCNLYTHRRSKHHQGQRRYQR